MARNHSVLIIGAGIAGLSAALELSRFGYQATIVEKANAPGGHAGQFCCKATDQCVKCGACLVEQTLMQVSGHPTVKLLTDCSISEITRAGRFTAILDHQENGQVIDFDAVVIATGFTAFDPAEKPYGYGRFANVVTNLDLERMFREKNSFSRPSDDTLPQRIAFIQCVGSRDAALKHLWCSKACCASAIRLAGMIKHRQPETTITVFYQDIQTFGKHFQSFYATAQQGLCFVRSIPGDIFPAENDRLKLMFFDPQSNRRQEALADLVVLSVGLMPRHGITRLARQLGLAETFSDYTGSNRQLRQSSRNNGIFIAGTALSPMSIPETIHHATREANKVVDYLKGLSA